MPTDNNNNKDRDIIKQEYKCPRCYSILFEKKPKDKFVVRNINNTVRLFCTCGYYSDIIVKDEDFH